MLVTVMDKSLKSGAAKFEHYSVAVKTGTAQVADNATGGYYTDRHTHSFMGYFPAYDPKFIVFLYAVNPKGVAYAATATVPYSGGNAATYAAGSSVVSTGVTGLTATLVAGTLANGTGNLSFTVAGTPSASRRPRLHGELPLSPPGW